MREIDFTRSLREIVKEEGGPSTGLIQIAPEIVLEACDRLDRLAAENQDMHQICDAYMDKFKARAEQIEKLEGALEQIRDAETERCLRCEGNGQLYADGKAHFMSEDAPTIACGDCFGEGRIPSADPRDIAEQVLKGEKP